MHDFQDGHVPFGNYETYYKVFGKQDQDTLPLIVLHGGPGSAHNYMLDLSRLAESGRQVVFYDQSGCGQSTGPEDMEAYTFDLFMEELDNLRAQLSLDTVHILGHSWGGMLAIEYLLGNPRGVRSVTLASSMISMPLFIKELARLRKQLPKDVQQTLRKHEQQGTTNDQEYKDAYDAYHARHIRRIPDKPPYADAGENKKGEQIYHSLWGVNEAYPNGTLGSWDRIKDLGVISVPTLVTSGAYDELTPLQAQTTQNAIPGAKRVEFEFSAHLPHMEEPSAYVGVIRSFLESVEG